MDIFNLDIGGMFSTSCIVRNLNHYRRLLILTLCPLVFLAVLVVTYNLSKRKPSIIVRDVWSRHMYCVLLVSFLIFASSSKVIFNIFMCDNDAVVGKSFLRADYSLECGKYIHYTFQFYASVMMLVYPSGIPAFYTILLYRNKEQLNPQSDQEDRDFNPEVKPFGFFLWKDFKSDHYYHEPLECGRRIL